MTALAVVLASCGGSGDPRSNPGGPFTNIGAGDAGTPTGDSSTGGDAARDGAADTGDVRTGGTTGAGGTTGTTGSGGTTAGVDGGTSDVSLGGGGRGGGGGAGGEATGSGGAFSLAACQACETQYCSADKDLADLFGLCVSGNDPVTGMPGRAAGGPAQGTLKKDLCQEVLACVRRNSACITWSEFEYVQPCYCGQGVGDLQCLSTPSGPCKAEIERAAEIRSAALAGEDVASRLTDPGYGLGAAVNLIQECDEKFCRGVCLGFSGGGGGSGTGNGGGGGTVNAGGTSGGRGGTGSGATSAAGGAAGTTGGGGMSGANTGGAGGAATYVQCHMCEQQQCPEALTGCEQLSGTAATGPGMGKARKDLCLDVLACARGSKCSKNMGDAQPCYCGTAGDIPCLTGAANGPCKAVVEAAAETTEAGVIAERFSVPEFAIGGAVGVISCDYEFCNSKCANGDFGGVPGSGGSQGSGGATVIIISPPPPPETGGAPGTGGTASTGGAGGSVATGGAGGAGGLGGIAGTTGSGGVVSTGGQVGSGGVVASGGIGGTTGSGGVVSTGGQAGGGGFGGVPNGPCPDLDHNGTSDCQESLAINPGFHASADYWLPEDFMAHAWDGTRDAAGASDSGGLSVTNPNVADIDGMTEGGSRQCIRVTAGATYRLALQLFIASGQGIGSGSVSIRYYSSTNCTGTASAFWQSGQMGDTNGWRLVEGTTLAPTGAQSMFLRLVVLKSFRNPAFRIFFDNVLFKPQ